MVLLVNVSPLVETQIGYPFHQTRCGKHREKATIGWRGMPKARSALCLITGVDCCKLVLGCDWSLISGLTSAGEESWGGRAS